MGVSGATGVIVRNNIWQNCQSAPGFQSVEQADNNILNTGGVSFVNAGAGNFRLSTNTAAGADLGVNFNTDPDGVTRTTWSRGAFEYAP